MGTRGRRRSGSMWEVELLDSVTCVEGQSGEQGEEDDTQVLTWVLSGSDEWGWGIWDAEQV